MFRPFFLNLKQHHLIIENAYLSSLKRKEDKKKDNAISLSSCFTNGLLIFLLTVMSAQDPPSLSINQNSPYTPSKK